MKVKFRDVMCMGNKTYLAGDTIEVGDITGQQLIDKEYADLVEDDDKSKTKATKKAADKKE
ncbi:hypothetical protein ACTXLW_00605 [Psychrobacter celer]|uniref:hypothetical protein n=1 Tax=Psychrobacter celer TaxID=306572 RepID=UPI003FD31320